MKIKDVQLSAESTQLLIRARKQHSIVARARKRYELECADRPIISSPRMDGMPRGSRNLSGLEKRYIHLEKFEQRLAKEEKILQQAQKEARNVIYSLPDALQDFCFWYYFEGMSMPEVAAWLDRDISTCWRYKKAIESAEKPSQSDL